MTAEDAMIGFASAIVASGLTGTVSPIGLHPSSGWSRPRPLRPGAGGGR